MVTWKHVNINWILLIYIWIAFQGQSIINLSVRRTCNMLKCNKNIWHYLGPYHEDICYIYRTFECSKPDTGAIPMSTLYFYMSFWTVTEISPLDDCQNFYIIPDQWSSDNHSVRWTKIFILINIWLVPYSKSWSIRIYYWRSNQRSHNNIHPHVYRNTLIQN